MSAIFTVRDFETTDFQNMTGLSTVTKNLQLDDLKNTFITIDYKEKAVWVNYENPKLNLKIIVCLDFKLQIVRIVRLECTYRSFDQAFLNLIVGIKLYADKVFAGIETFAYGKFSILEKFPHYYACARFGFTANPYYLPEILKVEENFRNSINQIDSKYTSIENLFHTNEGLAYWREHGFEWLAEFSLHDCSKNMDYLKKELGLIGYSNLLSGLNRQ